MSTKKNPFLRLNLHRDKLDDAIENFFSFRKEECTYGKVKLCSESRYRLEYTVNRTKQMLDFRFNNDGSTSLDLNPGGINDFKNELAISLINSPICTSPNTSMFENPYFVLNDLILTDVEAVLSSISSDENVTEDSACDINGGKRWVLINKEGEKVTISYYFRSSKTVVQGRPLKLFNEVYSTLMILLDIEIIPKVMEENLEFNTVGSISKDDIRSSLDQYIPNAIDHMSSSLKKMLHQALFNLRINMDMFEYSLLTFPALKSLEGHLKYVMRENNIPLIQKRFSMFDFDNVTLKHFLHSDYTNELNQNKIDAINQAYNFYHRNRHSIFHWAEVDKLPVDLTRQIQNIGEAHAIITDTFKLIDQYYEAS